MISGGISGQENRPVKFSQMAGSGISIITGK
jgi:hypothetical protein